MIRLPKILIGLLWVSTCMGSSTAKDFYSSDGIVNHDSLEISRKNWEIYDLHNSFPEEMIERSRDILRFLDEQPGDIPFERSVTLKNIGLAYWRLSQYDSSLLYQRSAIAISDRIGSDSLSAKIISNMALVYKDKGQYSFSLENSFQAYRVFQDLGDEYNESFVAGNIATVYMLMHNYADAMQYYQHSLQLGEKLNSELSICANYSFLGEVHYHLQDLDQSRHYLTKAVSYCQGANISYYLSEAYFNLGRLYQKINKGDSSQLNFLMALEIKTELRDQKGKAATLNAMAQLNLDLDNFNQASVYLDSAYTIALGHDLLFEMRSNYYHRIRYDSLMKNYASALTNYRLYSQLSDSIYNLLKVNEIAEVILQFETDNIQKENLLQSEVLKRQVFQNRFIYALLIFSALVILLLTYILKNKNQINRKLKRLNLEINLQKEEIQIKSDEIGKAQKATNQKNKTLTETLHQLQSTQKQLIESEKMASLGLLSAGVGHEINNPLNFIKGGVVGLSRYSEDTNLNEDEEFSGYLEIINEGVDRANSIIRSLSNFSRSGGNMNEHCNVNETIDNCLIILQSQLKYKVKVIKEYNHESLLQVGNSGRLHQAFLNILSNAEQSISDHGTITIKTQSNDGTNTIMISDTGAGIEQKDLKKIMDPFFTTKAPGEGTGLGLAITSKIIQEHGGNIQVDSKVGEGTTFVITLPATERIEENEVK